MTTGQWITGRSVEEVARQFKVQPDTAKDWATCASRIIRLCIEENGAREDIRARMVATLDRIVAQNVTRDGKTAVAAISEQGKLLGLVTQRHTVDMTVKQYESLEPSQMLARIRDQRAKLDEAERVLLEEHPELTRARLANAPAERTPENPSACCHVGGCTLQPGHPGGHRP